MRRSQQWRAQVQNDLITFATHDGQEYLVAPCVAIVPGVLNRALVPMHAIEDTFQAWNGRPIVVNHPEGEDGEALSANDPKIIESVGIGTIWHANTTDDRLHVEAWINTAKAEALGGEAALLVQRMRNKEATEVSTGYWGVMREKEGEFKGNSYDEITDLIIPDHLAFLPNGIGACNWGDGCGVPRRNTQSLPDTSNTLYETVLRAVRHALPSWGSSTSTDSSPTRNMTVTDQFAILNALVSKEMEAEGVEIWRWYILDMEDNTVIMRMDGRLMRRSFNITESDDIELTGEWEEVNQKTTFTPASAQCACGNPLTQQEEPIVSDQPEQVDTLKVYLDAQGVTQEELQSALQARNEARQNAIQAIVEHAQLDADDLRAMSDKALIALAEKVTPKAGLESIPSDSPESVSDFTGRGQPTPPVRPNQIPEPPRILRPAAKTA